MRATLGAVPGSHGSARGILEAVHRAFSIVSSALLQVPGTLDALWTVGADIGRHARAVRIFGPVCYKWQQLIDGSIISAHADAHADACAQVRAQAQAQAQAQASSHGCKHADRERDT